MATKKQATRPIPTNMTYADAVGWVDRNTPTIKVLCDAGHRLSRLCIERYFESVNHQNPRTFREFIAVTNALAALFLHIPSRKELREKYGVFASDDINMPHQPPEIIL